MSSRLALQATNGAKQKGWGRAESQRLSLLRPTASSSCSLLHLSEKFKDAGRKAELKPS